MSQKKLEKKIKEIEEKGILDDDSGNESSVSSNEKEAAQVSAGNEVLENREKGEGEPGVANAGSGVAETTGCDTAGSSGFVEAALAARTLDGSVGVGVEGRGSSAQLGLSAPNLADVGDEAVSQAEPSERVAKSLVEPRRGKRERYTKKPKTAEAEEEELERPPKKATKKTPKNR